MLAELNRRARPLRPAMLLFTLANGSEAICLARLGQDALLSYSQVLPWLLGLEAMGFALGAGCASLFSRCKPEQRHNCVLTCLMAAALLGLLLAALAQLSASCLEENKLIRAEVFNYLGLWRWALPLAFLNFSLLGLLRARDQSQKASWVMSITALTQICLMPLLILSASTPAAALSAAASAHVYCQLVQLALLFFASRHTIKHYRNKAYQLCFGTLNQLLKLAGPITLSNLLIPVSTAFSLHQLAKLESYYASAFSLALRIEGLLLVGFYAWSSVVGPIAAKHLIANSNHISIETLTSACWQLSVRHGLKLAVFAGLLTFTIEYWLTACKESQPILQAYFLLVPLSYVGYGFMMLCTGMLNGLGYALSSLALSLLRCVIILWPALWIMTSWPANTWTFMAFSMSNMGAALIALYLLTPRNEHNRPNTIGVSPLKKTIQQGNKL